MGEFLGKYLGIKEIYPDRPKGEKIPISEIRLDADNFKIEKLPRIFNNAVLLSDLLSSDGFWSKQARLLSNPEYDRICNYFDLLGKVKHKKEIWTQMNFGSIYKFNKWLKENHLDYGLS